MANTEQLIQAIDGVKTVDRIGQCRYFIEYEQAEGLGRLSTELHIVPREANRPLVKEIEKKIGKDIGAFLLATNYYEHDEGVIGMFNPIIKNGKLNLDYIYEATNENIEKLITEIISRYEKGYGEDEKKILRALANR